MAVSETTRKRIEAQGYIGLSDEMLADVGTWLRFAPAICMTWIAVATLYASAIWIWALVPFAALGALLPGHPFEILYNHGIRHALGKPHLPPARGPRRFACAVAAVWLVPVGWSFYVGAVTVGYLLGASLAIAAAVPTFTGFCIPSFFFGLMFPRPGRDAT